MDSEVDVTFFVPCYNEEANVIRTFKNIISAANEVRVSYASFSWLDQNSYEC